MSTVQEIKGSGFKMCKHAALKSNTQEFEAELEPALELVQYR